MVDQSRAHVYYTGITTDRPLVNVNHLPVFSAVRRWVEAIREA